MSASLFRVMNGYPVVYPVVNPLVTESVRTQRQILNTLLCIRYAIAGCARSPAGCPSLNFLFSLLLKKDKQFTINDAY